RAPAGLNADLKTYSVTLSVSREEATALESFLAEHGERKAFLWRPPYGYRQRTVHCANWSSRASILLFGICSVFVQVVSVCRKRGRCR
ncbi:phage tail protein, partial [Escherichia coli]|uniref:phage tail protein n=1 Tax=Escherichia coli TaxID=562 RepID=UPI0010CBD07A